MSSDESTDAFSAGKTDVAHVCVNVLLFYAVVIQLVEQKLLKSGFILVQHFHRVGGGVVVVIIRSCDDFDILRMMMMLFFFFFLVFIFCWFRALDAKTIQTASPAMIPFSAIGHTKCSPDWTL